MLDQLRYKIYIPTQQHNTFHIKIRVMIVIAKLSSFSIHQVSILKY